MSGTLLHKRRSGIPNPLNASWVGGADWDAEHAFSGGVDGAILTRDSTQTDGAGWRVYLDLPETTGVNIGMLTKSGTRFLHNFADPTADGLNTFLGKSAGNLTLSPSGGASTLASRNTGLGVNALAALTTGSYNVAVGANALSLATTGRGNIGIGSDALTHLLGATDNVSIGWDSSHTLTTGLRNIAIGTDSLFTNNADNNVGIGANALYATTTGGNNAAFGTNALTSNQGGVYNIAIGTDAVSSAVSASYNIGIGAASLFKTTGGSNFAIGFTAMHENTTGINNLAIGWQALFSNNGSSNVVLGYNAALNQTALSNGLIIDNQDRTSAALELTNALIVGHFDAAPANQTLVFNSALKVTQLGARVASDKYVVIDASGNLHISAIGPSS